MFRMADAHALVIGIARYQHVDPLPQVKDAEEIHDLLIDPASCGYAPENVQLLLDEQATGLAIREALSRLAECSNAQSTIFLYLSGHGARVASGPNADEFVLPVDARYPPDEELAASAISGAELLRALNAIPARKMLVIFDCCHAAGIARPKGLRPATLQPGLSDGYYEGLKSGRGRAVLASSRSTEYSYVMPGASYGLFTQHLLAGLRGGIASEDGLIRVFDLFEYLQPKVTAVRRDQHPIFLADLEENFPIALYRGGMRAPTSAVEQEYRYDAYISYVDRGPDADWVWNTLMPRLESTGLRVAVSGDVEEPGVERVVGVERGIRQSKRTVVVLSEAYLADHMAGFESVLGQTMGIQEGTYRVLPVKIGPIDARGLPVRLSMLTTLDLASPSRADREFGRLITALQGPLPHM